MAGPEACQSEGKLNSLSAHIELPTMRPLSHYPPRLCVDLTELMKDVYARPCRCLLAEHNVGAKGIKSGKLKREAWNKP